MNTEDSLDAVSVIGADNSGTGKTDATALLHRLGTVAMTTDTSSEEIGTAAPVANLALRRMSRQLANSMVRLVDDVADLLDQLAAQDATQSGVRRSTSPVMTEAEQLRLELIAGGYRLANELRKVVQVQHGQVLTPGKKHVATARREQGSENHSSAIVIHIQDVLHCIRGKLRDSQ